MILSKFYIEKINMSETEWAIVWILWWIGISEILNYFHMSWEWLIIMTTMLVLDLIFWLLSAKSRWQQIESKRLQEWLMKKMTRRLLPFIVVLWLKRTWFAWIDWLVKVVMWMIIFSELYSIIWHIYSINYKEELPEIDAFKMLLNSITKMLKKLINQKNDEIEPKDEKEDKKDFTS